MVMFGFNHCLFIINDPGAVDPKPKRMTKAGEELTEVIGLISGAFVVGKTIVQKPCITGAIKIAKRRHPGLDRTNNVVDELCTPFQQFFLSAIRVSANNRLTGQNRYNTHRPAPTDPHAQDHLFAKDD